VGKRRDPWDRGRVSIGQWKELLGHLEKDNEMGLGSRCKGTVKLIGTNPEWKLIQFRKSIARVWRINGIDLWEKWN
jgi:hypothetical protein